MNILNISTWNVWDSEALLWTGSLKRTPKLTFFGIYLLFQIS